MNFFLRLSIMFSEETMSISYLMSTFCQDFNKSVTNTSDECMFHWLLSC